jgi:hypothetical protein
MKKLFTFLAILTATNIFAQSITPDSLDKQITAHFDKYKPELYRYSGLAFYGESKTTFDKEQITKELQLYNEVRNSDLINKPTNTVFALCHNLLIHSPEKGKEFLKLLNKQTEDKEIIGNLFTELIFTGEYGEQIALDNLESNNTGWSKTWAGYLSSLAVYESSIPRIDKMLQQTNDTEIKQDLIGALMYISSPKSMEIVKQIIESTKNDEVQTKAIYAFAELSGNDGIKYFNSTYKKLAVQWLNEALCFVSSSVVADSFRASKSPTSCSCKTLFIKKLPDNKPGLIINSEGIIDNSSGVSAGLVLWKDIIEITTSNVMNQKFLMFIVKNPEEYINRQNGIVKRKAMEMNYRSYGSPISISANTLDTNFEELYELLQRKFNKNK